MPRRPPGKWWKRCIAGVEGSGSAIDPAAVCGATWYHRLSDEKKRRITREIEKASPKKRRR